MKREIRIALIGNPNIGKTTIFNVLTGLRRHVGNWPGVTVEKKTGRLSRNGYDIEVVDPPEPTALRPTLRMRSSPGISSSKETRTSSSRSLMRQTWSGTST